MRSAVPENSRRVPSLRFSTHVFPGPSPLARLLQLVVILQGEQCPNARRLADLFEVSRRTIYRDLATLSAAGITVVYRSDRQGYQLARERYLQPPRLEEGEAEALLVLVRQACFGDELGLRDAASRAIEKLLQTLPDVDRRRLVAMSELIAEPLSGRGMAEERRELHQAILFALGERRQIRIWFREPGQEELETTKLGIYRMAVVEGRWGLIGRSTLHCRVVLIPLEVIERVQLTSDPYRIPPRFQLERFLARGGSEPRRNRR